MWKVIAAALLTLSISDFASLETIDPFIIGGRDAVLGQFPYFASIRYGDLLEHGCGAGILNTRWLITASHCLLGGQLQVMVGAVGVSDQGDRYNIIQSVVHPNFPPTLEHMHNYSNHHDIGLIKVDRDIIFHDHVRPIPLVRRRVIGTVFSMVAGFGVSYLDRRWEVVEVPDTLQFMWTSTITNTECAVRAALFGKLESRTATPTIYSGHLCTLNSRGTGTCFGDSGSPIITRDGVVGVVVSGVLPCGRGAPDIFVRVSTYIRWIDSYIHDLS